MFTSDTDRNLRTSLIYMIISIVLAAAGAVYEHFSFGVYSYFMIYAFAVPLICGALPYMIIHMRSAQINKVFSSVWYHAAVATLTLGSIVHGALSICGRPNELVIAYPAAAVILLAATAFRAWAPAHKTAQETELT